MVENLKGLLIDEYLQEERVLVKWKSINGITLSRHLELYGSISFKADGYVLHNNTSVKDIVAVAPADIIALDVENNEYRLFFHPTTNALVAYKVIN